MVFITIKERLVAALLFFYFCLPCFMGLYRFVRYGLIRNDSILKQVISLLFLLALLQVRLDKGDP